MDIGMKIQRLDRRRFMRLVFNPISGKETMEMTDKPYTPEINLRGKIHPWVQMIKMSSSSNQPQIFL